MSPKLQIQLLGDFCLIVDDNPYRLSEQQQRLLAYLLLHRHAPHSRQKIAFLFWADFSESFAYRNFRKALHLLRKTLPDADSFLSITSKTLGWKNDSSFVLDVEELEQALSVLEQPGITDVSMIQRVLAIYQGELLPIFYDDWLLPLRSSLHERVVNTLIHTLSHLEAQHEFQVGLQVAGHLLRLDPLHETTYRHLMRLRLLSGDRAGALRAYHRCVGVLEQELGVSPSSETDALYQQLIKTETLLVESIAVVTSQRRDYIPLVGRQAEWKILQQAWLRMNQHGSHMLAIWGEAGIGKTRLVEELAHWARLRPGTVFYARAYAAEGDLSYAPITSWLRSNSLQLRLSQLEEVWLGELVRLLPEFQRQYPALPAPLPLGEGWQRQRFHEAIVHALMTAASPLVLILEDLQWCDAETLGWIRYLLRFDRNFPLLVIGTVRGEAIDEQHPLLGIRQQLQREAQWTELELSSLSLDATTELASYLAHKNVAAWGERLYQETEGNPLFVVEMVQTGLLDKLREVQDGERVALSPTVQSVIEQRLSQLSPLSRQLAHFAATMGRAFTAEVLSVASELSEDEMVQALDELWQRRIIREQGQGYDFSHDKIREVAYTQLSQTRRKWSHRRIGIALAQLYAGQLDTVVGELAVHAEESGQIEEALTYLIRAAEIDQTVGDYTNAVARLRHTLTLVPRLKQSIDAMMQRELSILVPLGTLLIATRGYADSEVEAAYQRAHQLCTHLSHDPNFMPILIGLALFYMIRGELHQAQAVGQQYLDLAEATQDDGLILEGLVTLGPILMYLGEFRKAAMLMERAMTLYNTERHGNHALIYGQDPALAGQSCLATALWMLGYTERSLALMQETVAMAQTVSHSYSFGLTQGFAAHYHHVRQDAAAVLPIASIGLEFALRHGFQYMIAVNGMLKGWATVKLSLPLKGEAGKEITTSIAQMQAAYEGFKHSGAGLFRGYYRSVISEAQAAIHQFDAALEGIAEGLENAERTHDYFWQAELYRLRGEWLLAQAADPQSAQIEMEAEKSFLQAIETAQAQEARMIELRAATSLASLWVRQGQASKVKRLLSPLVAWFPEGSNTPELQQAMALLAM